MTGLKEIQPLRGARLERALTALAAIDGDIAATLERLGPPPPRVVDPGLATLVRIIVGQQVSTKAAATVFARIADSCALLPSASAGCGMSAGALLELAETGLRGAGLSGRKAAYVLGLAEAVRDGAFDADALAGMSEADAITSITSLRGFGPWSAEIYLMFALGKGDIMPAGDLAIRVGYQCLKGLPEPPSAGQLRELTGSWSPWRSAGALVLWQIYGAATLD